MASGVRHSMFATLESAFSRVIGKDAVTQLKNDIALVDIITIGGDQLTGKSTLSKDIAGCLHANYISAGTVFRLEAKRRGLSVGELSILAKEDSDIDARIEYATCQAIMSGLPKALGAPAKPLLVIEGRNPGVMASYCRNILGKPNILSIYLSCTPRVQALRFLKRELSVSEAATMETMIGKSEFTCLANAGKALQTAVDQAFGPASAAGGPAERNPAREDAQRAVNVFRLNQTRDEDDRSRFLQLYHLPPYLDYRNHELYDLVIDTTAHTPADTLRDALSVMKTHPVGKGILQRGQLPGPVSKL